MTIKVKVETDDAKKIFESIEEFTLEEAQDFINDLYVEIVNRTPVDTGRAQRSWEKIQVNGLGDEGVIGNPQEYVKYLEDGTPKMSPRKFITTSIIKELNKRR